MAAWGRDSPATPLRPTDVMILDFLRSSYEAGATLGGWDRAALERKQA